MHYDAIVVLERLIVCFVCLLDRVVFVAMHEWTCFGCEMLV